jgi:hypothetical protein
MDNSVIEALLQQIIDQNSQMIDRLNELIVTVQEIAREMDRSEPQAFPAHLSALLSQILAELKNRSNL